MEYEIIEKCRFGNVGDVVSYKTYHYDANFEERKRYFRERGATHTAADSHGVDNDSRQYRDDESYPVWTDGDATSSVSSSNSLAEDTVEFGGGSFGGGGASSDYEDSGYGRDDNYEDDADTSDYGDSDSGSDCGSDD